MSLIEQPLNHSLRTLEGDMLPLGVFRGLAMVLCTMASRDKHRDQLIDLQALSDRYLGQGLMVIGIPVLDFGSETQDEEALRQILREQVRLTFPLMAPIHAAPPNQHSLFKTLTELSNRPGPVRSPFEKFVVDGDGFVVERFGPDVRPTSSHLIRAVEGVLPTIV